MKYIKFFLVVVLTAPVCRCWAQDDVAITTDTLESGLSRLKQSVERLTADNEQLTRRNNALKQEVYQLQTRLGLLTGQNSLLNKTVMKLQEQNQPRSEQISRLEKENLDWDTHIQKAEGDIRQISPSSGNFTQESQMTNHRQKEKLKLMKMIYDSQRRQEALNGSILDEKKQTLLLPAASVLARQQVLKKQVKDLEDKIAGFSNQWDEAQLQALEGELKTLEKNYIQLKDLLGQMSKKAQEARMTVSQHVEQGKLEDNINDLNHQEAGLKADLEDLRSQMVDLDKRKFSLERLIRQQP